MKLFFSIFVFLLLSQPLLSQDQKLEYRVKTKGVTIGSLYLDLKKTDDYYEFSLKLKNKGLFSKLYAFNGNYKVSGGVVNKQLIPNEYNQKWVTKKKQREVKIFFKHKNIYKLVIKPHEKEMARIEYKKLENYVDPLTSFLNLLLHSRPSKTIDGRRIYILYPEVADNYKKILIKDFKNIWADHKRNDLEYLEFFQEKDVTLPKKINVMFKGSLFSLIKL